MVDSPLGGDRSIQLSYGATRVSGIAVLFSVLVVDPDGPFYRHLPALRSVISRRNLSSWRRAQTSAPALPDS